MELNYETLRENVLSNTGRKVCRIKDLKIFINSVTREAVVKVLVNTPFPSEKRIELAKAISTILLNNYAYLKAVLTYIWCEKN